MTPYDNVGARYTGWLILMIAVCCAVDGWGGTVSRRVARSSPYALCLEDSSYVTQRQKALNRSRILFAKANALFDDNFNFESTCMLKQLKEILRLDEQFNLDLPMLSDIYAKIAICYQDLGNDSLAMASLRVANSSRKNSGSDRISFNIYLTLGSLFLKSYGYDSAEYYFGCIENKISAYRDLRSNEFYRLYNELGALHYLEGDYKLALAYYEQALQHGLAVFPMQAEQLVVVQNNIIAALLELDRPQDAIKKYRALLSYQHTLPVLYQNLGKTYQRTGQYDSALYFLKKAEVTATDQVLMIKLFNNLAGTYIGLGDYEHAASYLDRSISANKKLYKTKNAALAYSHIYKAKIYEKQNNLHDALQEYQQAIITLHFDFNDSNYYHNPEDLQKVISRQYFFECLHYKASAFLKSYHSFLEHNDLRAAFENYDLAIRMMDVIRKGQSSDEAKLMFNNKTHHVYDEAIQVAFELYEHTKDIRYKEAAFAFSEEAKMIVLAEIVGDVRLQKLSGIPQHLVNEERKIKQHINRALARLGDARDSLKNIQLRDELAGLEIELSRIQQELEQNDKYRRLRYAQQPLTTAEIQHYLQPTQALIEYYLTSSDIFIFVVTTDKFVAQRRPLSQLFFEAFDKLKNSLYGASQGSTYYGWQSSHVIYNFIIEPAIEQLADKKRWIAVPDGDLNYIPLEALVSDTTSNRFVIEDHAIQYVYSSALLLSPSASKPLSRAANVLAFAPFSDDSKRSTVLYPLSGSGREIKALPGKHYLNHQATKAAFLGQAQAYDIIHLATHAETFGEDPLRSYIAFFTDSASPPYQSRLYMPEIYNLDLHKTHMVVVSACEAGGGHLMKGEGLMSLSRAFGVAGCSSVVTSLWKADDESSASMMISMYHHLRDGDSRDEALRKAKLEYLRSNKEFRLNAPVFWANFICIGDASPLYENHKTENKIALVMLSAALVIIILAIKSKLGRAEVMIPDRTFLNN